MFEDFRGIFEVTHGPGAEILDQNLTSKQGPRLGFAILGNGFWCVLTAAPNRLKIVI